MIYVSEKAKDRVVQLMTEKQFSPDDYFLRVSVESGGCSGLSYKMDFDKEKKPMDQEFEDKGVKVVTDLKSFIPRKYHPRIQRWIKRKRLLFQ